MILVAAISADVRRLLRSTPAHSTRDDRYEVSLPERDGSVAAGRQRTMRAIQIRDHVLPLVRERGMFERLQGSRASICMIHWRIGALKFMLRTPFSGWPTRWQSHQSLSYRAAILVQRARPVLGYGLDVWQGRKVMSLQWDAKGDTEVISFHPGPWEDEVLSLR